MEFNNFNVMNYVKVNNEMVNILKKEIITDLKNGNPFLLSDIFNILTKNIKTIEYSKNDYKTGIEELVNQVSKFMAYQEACMDLINENKIMPVNFYYHSNSGTISLPVKLIEHNGAYSTTTSSTRIDNIPFIPYDNFIIRPSKSID